MAGLRGATPKGGWTAELGPDDVVHTLVVVHTDEGLTGYGSTSTNDELARAAVKTLMPYWSGENALEPERVSEKLHRSTILARTRRFAYPRHQRHRHRPLGYPRQGDGPTGRATPRRSVPRKGTALCLAPRGFARSLEGRTSSSSLAAASGRSRSVGVPSGGKTRARTRPWSRRRERRQAPKHS